ncbi:MAG: PKD domain-containing protein [Methanoregulaceae archaeon]|nr:PKD domain-containing protein [Methanoregulaceae archaeon]
MSSIRAGQAGILSRIIVIVLVAFITGEPAFAQADYFIEVVPVGTRHIGEKIIITATTNLPPGEAVLFEVRSAMPVPLKSRTGEFSGASGTVTVPPRAGRTSTVGFDLDLSTFKPGNYQVTVQAVKHQVTGSGMFSVEAAIILEKPVPSFTFSPLLPLVNQPVTFNASCSTAGQGRIISYRWDLDDGRGFTDPSDSPEILHTFGTAGTFTIGLEVTDSNKQQARTYHRVQVGLPSPPIADFSLSPENGYASQDIPLEVAVSDRSTGDPVTWAWSVDGRVVSESRTFSGYRFTETGTHTVGLTVGNKYGTGTKERNVTVFRPAGSEVETTTPVGTVITVPPTVIPPETCRIFTIPCEWFGLIPLGAAVVLAYRYLKERPKKGEDGPRKHDPEKSVRKSKERRPPDVTIDARGGIGSVAGGPKNLDIHLDSEAGIEHPDMVKKKGGE